MAFPAHASMELMNVQQHYIHISHTIFHSNWTTDVKSTYIKFICTCKWSANVNALIFTNHNHSLFFGHAFCIVFQANKNAGNTEKFLLMCHSKLCFSLHWISPNSSLRNNFFNEILHQITCKFANSLVPDSRSWTNRLGQYRVLLLLWTEHLNMIFR